MAREGKYLHADALFEAISQASSLLPKPIERVVVRGSLILVDGGGRRITFRQGTSETTTGVDQPPSAGGTRGEAILVSETNAGPLPWLTKWLPFGR